MIDKQTDAQRKAWAALAAVNAADALHVLVQRGDILDLRELGDGWHEYRLPPKEKSVKEDPDAALLRRLVEQDVCPCRSQEWAYLEPELSRIADRLDNEQSNEELPDELNEALRRLRMMDNPFKFNQQTRESFKEILRYFGMYPYQAEQ